LTMLLYEVTRYSIDFHQQHLHTLSSSRSPHKIFTSTKTTHTRGQRLNSTKVLCEIIRKQPQKTIPPTEIKINAKSSTQLNDLLPNNPFSNQCCVITITKTAPETWTH